MSKKKKILKIIKYVGVGLFVAMLLSLCLASCKKLKGEEMPINYGSYTTFVTIDDVSLNVDTYEGTLIELASIQNNVINFGSPTSYDFICEEAILMAGPYETYGASSIEYNKAYLITYIQDGNDWEIQSAAEYNTYIGWQIGGNYDNGYVAGINANDATEVYNQGFAYGQQQAQSQFTEALNDALSDKDATISALQDDIIYYQEIINSGSSPWGNFKSLLGTIFIFPIKFFKEGFDVDFFGVNLGGLIIGLGLLGISLAIVGAVLGKRASS